MNTLRAKEIPKTCFIQEPEKSPEVSRFLTKWSTKKSWDVKLEQGVKLVAAAERHSNSRQNRNSWEGFGDLSSTGLVVMAEQEPCGLRENPAFLRGRTAPPLHLSILNFLTLLIFI